jgi:hypothetical protein
MPRRSSVAPPKKALKRRPEPAPELVIAFEEAVLGGDDWFDALLETIADWELTEETVGGRLYRYLIGGEAFDWLLLAERLCEDLDGAIPKDEREALLFFGKMPFEMEEDDFRHAIGDAKHRAHLNFVYGVMVEEALQLTVEEEVLKEGRSSVWMRGENAEGQVFERIYGRPEYELLADFRAERELPPCEDLSYGDLRAFIYWLFKYRVNQSDPARVASDTRKALAQISRLEAGARRRAEHIESAMAPNGNIFDGEVVARFR